MLDQSHLHVKMKNVLPVHKLDTLAYLAHEDRACPLGQHEVFVYDTLEQLSAGNSGIDERFI